MPFIGWGEGPFSQIIAEAPAAVCPSCGGHAAEVAAHSSSTKKTIFRCNGCKHEFDKPEKINEEKVKCGECGKVFSARVSAGADVECPKCGGTDVDLAEAASPMSYKCVDCKHIFTSQGHPDKCPKCGSEKWGKVDDKGNWTVQEDTTKDPKLNQPDYAYDNKTKKCKGCGLPKSPVNKEGFCRQCVIDNNKEDGLQEETEYPKTLTIKDVTYSVADKGEEDHLNQLLRTAEERGGSERLQRLAVAKGTYGVKK